jgi:hypothetical protein
MCTTVCSVQYTNFYLYVVHQCLKNGLKLFGYNLTDCLFTHLENILQTGVRAACGPKSQCSFTLSWTGIVAQNLVSLFTISGLTKLISRSKYVGAFRANVLYRLLNTWRFKSGNKPVPLYTDLFLYNSVCHQHLSRRFLLLDNMWSISMKVAPIYL